MKPQSAAGRAAHRVFHVAVIIKGIDGVVEAAAGLLLLVIPTHRLQQIADILTLHELGKDPHDPLVRFVLPFVERISYGELSFRTFGAIYLLVHGAIKVVLVIGLLMKKPTAYPVAIVAFLLFLAYQANRYTHTHSRTILVLAALDVPVILLTWREYRRLRRG